MQRYFNAHCFRDFDDLRQTPAIIKTEAEAPNRCRGKDIIHYKSYFPSPNFFTQCPVEKLLKWRKCMALTTSPIRQPRPKGNDGNKEDLDR